MWRARLGVPRRHSCRRPAFACRSTKRWKKISAPPCTSTPHHLDLGCSLEHGSFERTARKTTVIIQEESLIFFILRLLERLRAQGTAPAADLMKYGRHLESFK